MKLHAILCVAALAFVTAGCAHDAGTAIEPGPYMAPLVPADLNSVAFLNPQLEKHVAVTKTFHRRTASNTFEVVTTFKNLCDCPIQLQARTQYFNSDRQPQEGPNAWQPVYLPPNGIETYVSRSYNTGLEYYHVEVMSL